MFVPICVISFYIRQGLDKVLLMFDTNVSGWEETKLQTLCSQKWLCEFSSPLVELFHTHQCPCLCIKQDVSSADFIL